MDKPADLGLIGLVLLGGGVCAAGALKDLAEKR